MRKLVVPFMAAAAIIGALLLADPAEAAPSDLQFRQFGPQVCRVLDQAPSTEGVIAVLSNLVGQGWPADEAGEIVGRSVVNNCPQHLPLLTQFVEKYRNRGSLVSTSVPYCNGRNTPCYCPDDHTWRTDAFSSCQSYWSGPPVSGDDDNDGSIWNRRYS